MITVLLFSDLDKIHTGIGDRLSVFFQWTTTFFAGIVVGFVYEWRLTLVMLGATPFLVASSAFLIRVSSFHKRRFVYKASARYTYVA